MTTLVVRAKRLITPTFQLDAELDLEFGDKRPVVGLFGASGSGKSTLLAAIAGLAPLSTGRISLDGRALYDSGAGILLRPEERAVGLVPQDGLLFPHLDVRSNLRYGARRAGERTGATEERVVDVLELGPLLNRRAQWLSGGERQRVAIGRALLAAPRLLLLDEPVSALDEDARWRVLSFVERVVSELRVPTLFVSHARSEVLRLTAEAARIDAGRIVQVGPTSEVLGDDAADHATWNVLRLEPFGDGSAARHGAGEVVLPARVAPGTACWCRLSSAAIEVELEADAADHARSSARNQIPGSVVHLQRLGARVRVVIETGAGAGVPLVADVTPGSAERLALTPGVRVLCRFKALAVELLA